MIRAGTGRRGSGRVGVRPATRSTATTPTCALSERAAATTTAEPSSSHEDHICGSSTGPWRDRRGGPAPRRARSVRRIAELFLGALGADRPMLKRCPSAESISMAATQVFDTSLDECSCCNRRGGVIYRTRATAPCYCRSQLQLWFPKLQASPPGFFGQWTLFRIAGIPGRGIITATRYPPSRVTAYCPEGDMTWHQAQ